MRSVKDVFGSVMKLPKGSSRESIYKPIDSANLEIRLLHVDLTSKSRTGKIKCWLEPVSLLDEQLSVFYEAISWCWGDPTPRKTILLNDVRCKISENAEKVLRRLCFEQGHAVVWLDAVCIDQSNIQERGEQVAIMRNVYSRAARTLIWLGEDDDGRAQATLGSIDKLLLQCRDETDDYRNLRDTFWEPQGSSHYSDLPLPKCDWEALKSFFSASLFSRLWIIQEIFVSKEAWCFRGPHSKSWADISLASQWLNHRKYSRNPYMGQNVGGIHNAAVIWRQAYLKSYIATWLSLSLSFHASLPLDKVYGLLGLMQKNAGGAFELTPDYNARVDDVYAAATRLAIDELSDTPNQLDIMQFAQRLVPPGVEKSDECNQTPSWVPRYDWEEDTWRSPGFTMRFGEGAANGLPATVRECDPENPRVLSVKGTLVSRVIWRSSLLSTAMLNRDDHVHGLAEKLLSCRSAAQKQGHPDKAIAVALTARRDAMSNDALRDKDFLDSYRDCMQWCEAVMQEEQKRDSSSGRALAAVLKYRQALWHGARNRFFFTTASGRIGSGPPGMEVNDAVCILLGCTVPMVLREEKSGRWRLLGEAYVHDIMEGEYIRQLQDQGRLEDETRWFDIE